MLKNSGGQKIKHEINIIQNQEVNNTVQKLDRIMIVDDEPYNVDSLKIIVQCATFDRPNIDLKNRLDTACNGVDALKMI
jgi:hypothetical protein